MKKSVSLGFLFVMLSAFGFAQDLGQVKNDIDAERFDTAKKTLKSMIFGNNKNTRKSGRINSNKTILLFIYL